MSPNAEHQHKSEELQNGEDLKKQNRQDWIWTIVLIILGMIVTTIVLSNLGELISLLGFK